MPLSILIWLPAAVALVAAFLPARLTPRVVFCGSFVAVGLAVGYVAGFDRDQPGLQHVTDRDWIAQLGIHYKLGLDGLNLFLILVTTILFAAAFLAANLRDWERPRLFYFMFALAESGVLGAFCAQDLALFVAFFDLMLIPFYFLIGAWGGRDRVRATTKLVIYTLVGSLFMLAAAIATGVIAAQGNAPLSFALSDLAAVQLPKGSQNWIFLCFAFAFLVKMPLFPFHGWMPDGYRAMPLPVVAVFSAVLSKVAAYGFLRVVLPLYPDASAHFQTLMLLIALVSILYGSVLALSQTDARLIVGFSSMAQLGFIVLGIFSLRPEGAQGALLQMVNHALVVVPLFLIVGALAARAGGSEDIRDMGGIAFRAPVLAGLFLIVAFANLAMPGSSNFVGEFYILLGVFQAKLAISAVAFTGVALASVYTLRAFIRAMHGRGGEQVESREISVSDGLAVVPLVALIVALACYPQLPLSRSERAVRASVRGAQQIVDPPPPQAAAAPAGGSSQIPIGQGAAPSDPDAAPTGDPGAAPAQGGTP
jgi:NADH-quinone oxidoreductase subunit M